MSTTYKENKAITFPEKVETTLQHTASEAWSNISPDAKRFLCNLTCRFQPFVQIAQQATMRVVVGFEILAMTSEGEGFAKIEQGARGLGIPPDLLRLALLRIALEAADRLRAMAKENNDDIGNLHFTVNLDSEAIRSHAFDAFLQFSKPLLFPGLAFEVNEDVNEADIKTIQLVHAAYAIPLVLDDINEMGKRVSYSSIHELEKDVVMAKLDVKTFHRLMNEAGSRPNETIEKMRGYMLNGKPFVVEGVETSLEEKFLEAHWPSAWGNLYAQGFCYKTLGHPWDRWLVPTLGGDGFILKQQDGAVSKQDGVTVRLYHWEDSPPDLSQKWDVFLDWSQHFDRMRRKVPDPSIWRNRLIPELEEAQRRIYLTKSRLIHFPGKACLSAGFALGWVFREVKGYQFEIQQGPDMWRTHPLVSTQRHWSVAQTEILKDESVKDLCVEISHQTNLSPWVDKYIQAYAQTFRARIKMFPDLGGIGQQIDCQTALKYALDAKQIIRQETDQYGCHTVHLFYAGPLGLAIFMGRLFNAMHAKIQCYEEQGEHGYTPSCLLSTAL